MGLVEVRLIILVIAAIAGGIGVSPLLWLLLLIVPIVMLTSGGFERRLWLPARWAARVAKKEKAHDASGG